MDVVGARDCSIGTVDWKAGRRGASWRIDAVARSSAVMDVIRVVWAMWVVVRYREVVVNRNKATRDLSQRYPGGTRVASQKVARCSRVCAVDGAS